MKCIVDILKQLCLDEAYNKYKVNETPIDVPLIFLNDQIQNPNEKKKLNQKKFYRIIEPERHHVIGLVSIAAANKNLHAICNGKLVFDDFPKARTNIGQKHW